MKIAISRPTIATVGLAFGVGAITAAAWAYVTKRSLAATYGAGAAQLRQQLETRGSALRTEIEALAAASAIEAVRDEVRSFGITSGMLADMRIAVEAASAVRAAAARSGQSVTGYIARLRG